MRLALPTSWGTLAGPADEIARLHRRCQRFTVHSPEALAAWIQARIDDICGLWRVECEALAITVEVQRDRVKIDGRADLDACWIPEAETIRISAMNAEAKHLVHELAHAIECFLVGSPLPGRMGEILAINAMQEII